MLNVEEFWARYAAREGSNRWSPAAMLAVDTGIVDPCVPEGGALLDLGCGTGDLFAPFLDRLAHVTAVDAQQPYLDRLPESPIVHAINADFRAYVPERVFDVALLFGVVTYLEFHEERAIYATLAAAVPDGAVIVKNQCGRQADVTVDSYSDELESEYQAYYPHLERQEATLGEYFDEVSVHRYPEELNRWPDTQHVAFVCRRARRPSL